MDIKPDPAILLSLITTVMPYGKYKGRLICDIPESYLVWCQTKDAWPKGKLGDLLKNVFVIKENGLDYLFAELKAIHNS